MPLLVGNGHAVLGLARTNEKAKAVDAAGATPVIADALDREELTAAIMRAKPDVIVHQLTALGGARSFRNLDRDFVLTNRFRTEVTDTMLAAARLAGARRFIAQSFCGWPFAREGGAVKTERDRLDPQPPANFSKTLAAIRYLEDAVQKAVDLPALILRYGLFYGPGTGIASDSPTVKLVRKRRMPIVGDGAGVWSFIHIKDAARATAAAVSRGDPGVYNIVDDEPAMVSTWLPALADAVGAGPPYRIPVWFGRLAMGDGGVSMMTRVRGGSNAKTKRELRWQPIYPSWRQGFVEGLG
ncbi:MAG TPA: NAD(P)-dependent oxidoreductase [Acetobacteraceae bacterium]|nr:NAD(P)-dependent oxidoreductase [Acetobacteraceae bacterium]